MKIISWNCSGKFRDKYKDIMELNGDIYIIQECENPDKYPISSYARNWTDYIWIGNNESKGLGIFTNKKISLQKLNWNNFSLEYFLPVRVNDQFNILCVWTKNWYIEEYFVYQTIHFDKFTKDMIIIGDFNSNAIWDSKHNKRNHSNVLKQLNTLNMVSAYHYVSGEKQGEELLPTFLFHKNQKKKYHIDHCFINPNKIKNYTVLYEDKWLKFSDHFPLSLEIKMDDYKE